MCKACELEFPLVYILLKKYIVIFLCEGLDPSTWKMIQKMGRVGRDSKEKALFIFMSEKRIKGTGN